MKYSIAETLDKCIEAMRQGKTKEECLALYPDAAPALAPLLEAAEYVRQAPKAEASEAAMRAGKVRLLQEAARLRTEKKQKPARPWRRLSFLASTTFALPQVRPLAWAPVLSLLLALSLIFGSVTTAMAAGRSLPDEPLYPIKLAGEQVQLTLTLTPTARADLALSLTEKRLGEIATLSSLGRSVPALPIERLTTGTAETLAMIGRVDEDSMQPRLQRYIELLSEEQALLTQVPVVPATQGRIAAALNSAKEHEILAASAMTDPSVLREPSSRGGRVPVISAKETATSVPTAEPAKTAPPTSTSIVLPVLPPATATPSSAPTNTVAPPATQTPTPVSPTNTTLPTRTASATPPAVQVKFSGAIESMAQGQWLVDGKTVRLDGNTHIENSFAARVGARVDVVALQAAGQALLASSIHVYPITETPAVLATASGIILSLGPASWNVGGQTIAVEAATTIEGTPALGLLADVSGRRRSGTLVATTIVVRGPAPETQIRGRIERMSAGSWLIGSQTVAIIAGISTISGVPALGSIAFGTAIQAETGLIAHNVTVQPAPVEEEFEGFINRIEGNTWTISGRRVVRGPATQVDESQARAQVGLRAHVLGTLQPDGAILASQIRVLAPTGRAVSPTTITSPLKTPTPTMPVVPTATATRPPQQPPATATPTSTPQRQAASPTATSTVQRLQLSPTATRTPQRLQLTPTATSTAAASAPSATRAPATATATATARR